MKTVKVDLTSSQAQSPTNSRQHEGRMLDESNTLKATQNKIEPKTNIHDAVPNSSSRECCDCKVEKMRDRPLSNK